MLLVTVKQDKLKGFTKDPEMLHSAKRPCVLIVHLRYKGHRYDFAVPLRSNIHPSTPKCEYFPLPPRSKTKPGHRHGIHYTKMFPIKRSWTERFHTKDNLHSAIMKSIIDKNEKRIVDDCRRYLADYENGLRPAFCTDIDYLITLLP